VGSGRDASYQIIPAVTGVLEARLRAPFSAALYVREGCEVFAGGVCSSRAETGYFVRIPTVAGVPRFLTVDGNGDATGSYQVELRLLEGAHL